MDCPNCLFNSNNNESYSTHLKKCIYYQYNLSYPNTISNKDLMLITQLSIIFLGKSVKTNNNINEIKKKIIRFKELGGLKDINLSDIYNIINEIKCNYISRDQINGLIKYYFKIDIDVINNVQNILKYL